ncbi:MAG: SsrA-binding protein SmpB [Candidatus Omnitrophica bacterium]|nr:SsrA-binding protein SmpB [Candidatus Omnitrophota bacterium]
MTNPVATNRQAHFNYFISDTFEAGIVLTGSEVKSVREGRVNLKDAYVKMMNGEPFVVGMHVSPYSHTENIDRIDPVQSRKLLLHQQEIEKLQSLVSKKSFTCIPLSVYFKRGFVKLEIGIGKGKKEHDKRQALKEKIHQREMKQALKRRSK